MFRFRAKASRGKPVGEAGIFGTAQDGADVASGEIRDLAAVNTEDHLGKRCPQDLW